MMCNRCIHNTFITISNELNSFKVRSRMQARRRVVRRRRYPSIYIPCFYGYTPSKMQNTICLHVRSYISIQLLLYVCIICIFFFPKTLYLYDNTFLCIEGLSTCISIKYFFKGLLIRIIGVAGLTPKFDSLNVRLYSESSRARVCFSRIEREIL